MEGARVAPWPRTSRCPPGRRPIVPFARCPTLPPQPPGRGSSPSTPPSALGYRTLQWAAKPGPPRFPPAGIHTFNRRQLSLASRLPDEGSKVAQTLLTDSPPLVLVFPVPTGPEPSEVPTLVNRVEATISACVISSSRHRIRLPANLAVSAPRCSIAGAYPP